MLSTKTLVDSCFHPFEESSWYMCWSKAWYLLICRSFSFLLFCFVSLQYFYSSTQTQNNSEGKEKERKKMDKTLKSLLSPAIGWQCCPRGCRCCAMPAMARMLLYWAAGREQRWWRCWRRWSRSWAASSRRRCSPSGSTTSPPALTRTGQISKPATHGGTPSPETCSWNGSTSRDRI